MLPLNRVKLAAMMVAESMVSLKVPVRFVLMATEVAVSAGVTEVTVGAVVSGAGSVVKLQTLLAARELSARSFAPVVTVAV